MLSCSSRQLLRKGLDLLLLVPARAQEDEGVGLVVARKDVVSLRAQPHGVKRNHWLSSLGGAGDGGCGRVAESNVVGRTRPAPLLLRTPPPPSRQDQHEAIAHGCCAERLPLDLHQWRERASHAAKRVLCKPASHPQLRRRSAAPHLCGHGGWLHRGQRHQLRAGPRRQQRAARSGLEIPTRSRWMRRPSVCSGPTDPKRCPTPCLMEQSRPCSRCCDTCAARRGDHR